MSFALQNTLKPIAGAALLSLALCGGASAAELTRSADVAGSPSEIWSKIGAFCAIKNWHPAIGTCSEDGKTPPTRVLVTKDGKVRFVEMQTARDDAAFTYSYNFIESPFPVSAYIGTISVADKGNGMSTVTWHGTFAPLPGKDKDASDAFAGVYEAGLAALKAKFAK